MLASQQRLHFIAFAWLSLSLAVSASAQSLLVAPSVQLPTDSTTQATTPVEKPAEAAASSAVTPATSTPTPDKRAENTELLRIAQRKLEEDTANTAAAQQVAHFQSMLAALAQQDVVDQQINDLLARKAELEKQLNTPVPAESEAGAVHSFVELDRLKDDLAAEQARAGLVDDRLSAAKSALEKAQRAEDECAVKRRQAQEAFDVGKNEPKSAELAAAAEQARQAAALATETVALRKRELEREKLLQEVQRLAVRLCQGQVTRLAPLVVFSEADLQEQIAQIKKKEDSAYRSLARAQNSLHNVNLQVQESQKQLDARNR